MLLSVSPDLLPTSRRPQSRVLLAGCVWVADGCIFQPVQLIHRLPITAWHQMPVGIDGDPDTVVSQLVFHVGQGFPILDQQTGEGMPQVVNAQPPQPCLCQQLRPDPPPEVMVVHQLLLAVGKDPRGLPPSPGSGFPSSVPG